MDQGTRRVQVARVHRQAVDPSDRSQDCVLTLTGVEQDVARLAEVVRLEEHELVVALELCDLVCVRGVDDVELAGLETVGAALDVDGDDELDLVEVREALVGQ